MVRALDRRSRRLRPLRALAFGVAIGAAISTIMLGATSAGAAKPPASAAPSANPFRIGRTLVIPHGGGDGQYPEDTMLAYEKTMAAGADVVDVDLQLSKDGVVVVIHDGTTKRTTGTVGTISEMTVAELQKLDAGWSFGSATSHPFRGKNVRIPTFAEVLKKFPKALLSIDLKNESMAMITPLCNLLRAYGRRSDAFVGSNSDAQILAFRRECPDVRTSATMVDVRASQAARLTDSKTFVPDVVVDQPPYRIGDRVLVDKESLGFAHAHGIAILTWVVNDPADMKRLLDLGVDGIYTSYPDRLLALTRARG